MIESLFFYNIEEEMQLAFWGSIYNFNSLIKSFNYYPIVDALPLLKNSLKYLRIFILFSLLIFAIAGRFLFIFFLEVN
jgi:hypothetical protein